MKMHIAKFHEEQNARRFATRGPKPQWIVLGDDGLFWVVRPRDAARLEAHGYEIL